jgi:anti-sigma factor RsiW
MNMITRHNYEEYFILYLDNELSSEQRRSVEEFTQLHPDLKEELELLQQTKFTPDEQVIFGQKEELLFSGTSSFITISNYEEWLVAYIDNELTPEQRKAVEAFADQHITVQKELELLQQTRLQPEAIVFPDKESLYRKEEKVRPIVWWRIAAAAVLFIGIGTTAVVLLNNKNGNETTGQGTVATTDGTKQAAKETPVVTGPVNNNQTTDPALADNTPSTTVDPVNPGNNNATAAQKNKTVIPEERKELQDNLPAIKNKPEEVFAVIKEDKPTNNLPQPLYNPNVINKPDNAVDANTAYTASNDNKEAQQQIPNNSVVTTTPPDTYNQQTDAKANPEVTDDIMYASNNNGKKGKLRGFLRKVTRTFEKRTNISATDDEERLLVGGLAIRLK